MPLKGCRVLIVEDDWFVAEVLTQELEDHGAEVLGPASSVAEAMGLLEQEGPPDAAVLDIHLADGTAFPVADVLKSREVPTVLATGETCEEAQALYPDLPCVAKPLPLSKVLELLDRG